MRGGRSFAISTAHHGNTSPPTTKIRASTIDPRYVSAAPSTHNARSAIITAYRLRRRSNSSSWDSGAVVIHNG